MFKIKKRKKAIMPTTLIKILLWIIFAVAIFFAVRGLLKKFGV